MAQYSIEPKTRKYVKGYEFLSFARKYKKQILDKGLDASKNVVYKPGEYIGKPGECIGNKKFLTQ